MKKNDSYPNNLSVQARVDCASFALTEAAVFLKSVKKYLSPNIKESTIRNIFEEDLAELEVKLKLAQAALWGRDDT